MSHLRIPKKSDRKLLIRIPKQAYCIESHLIETQYYRKHVPVIDLAEEPSPFQLTGSPIGTGKKQYCMLSEFLWYKLLTYSKQIGGVDTLALNGHSLTILCEVQGNPILPNPFRLKTGDNKYRYYGSICQAPNISNMECNLSPIAICALILLFRPSTIILGMCWGGGNRTSILLSSRIWEQSIQIENTKLFRQHEGSLLNVISLILAGSELLGNYHSIFSPVCGVRVKDILKAMWGNVNERDDMIYSTYPPFVLDKSENEAEPGYKNGNLWKRRVISKGEIQGNKTSFQIPHETREFLRHIKTMKNYADYLHAEKIWERMLFCKKNDIRGKYYGCSPKDIITNEELCRKLVENKFFKYPYKAYK